MTQPTPERIPLVTPQALPRSLCDHAGEAGLHPVMGLALLGQGEKGDLCFCDREPGGHFSEGDTSAYILCLPELEDSLRKIYPRATLLPVADPRASLIDLCDSWEKQGLVGVSSRIEAPFTLSSTARIGSHTFIDPRTRIDDDVVIGANCVIHAGCWIGRGTVIGDNCTVGSRGINAYRGKDGKIRSFPHLAGTLIDENVSIGSGSVIVRGILSSTRIGRDTVMGNLCNVGHGTDIGEKVWMSTGCLVGGHATLGGSATLGIGSTVRDNLVIGDGAQIGMGSVVVRAVRPGSSVFGNPAAPMPGIKAGPAR